MRTSVSGKSCYQGNSDARPGGMFRICHSAPSMKMNGFDQRRCMIYGNHLQWVYGDYPKELKILGEMLGLCVEVFA